MPSVCLGLAPQGMLARPAQDQEGGMQGESPTPASTLAGAVFVSYASQDAKAAQRICEALRAAGIEVWFDKSELRGGDAWDRQIRKQIHDCALFMPIISAHSQERLEGYFRREWKRSNARHGGGEAFPCAGRYRRDA
jgi:TIR domain